MTVFRKLYYKIVTLFCIFTTFSFVFNMERVGIGAACFYIFSGILCFGALSIGKEEFNPDRPVGNILLLLGWSLLGFEITSMGILCLIEKPENTSVMTAFLVIAALGLLVAYLVSIIKNKELYAILSIPLLIGGGLLAGLSTGKPVLAVLSILIILGALALFVYSLIKTALDD